MDTPFHIGMLKNSKLEEKYFASILNYSFLNLKKTRISK